MEIGGFGAIGLVITPQTQAKSLARLTTIIKSLEPQEDQQSINLNGVGFPFQAPFQAPFQVPLKTDNSLTPRQAWFSPRKTVAINESIGGICAEWICPYPPGIPVLLPGEKITTNALEFLQNIGAIGGELSGLLDPTFQTIQVIIER